MRKEFRKLKRVKKKESFLKNRFFLLGVAVVVCAELLLYGIVLLPLIHVQEVGVEGNTEVSENRVKSVVLDRLWRKFLFLPTASILLIDTGSMHDALLNDIPELESARIRRKFPNTLVISVQERKAAALWCQPPHLIISGGGQEFLCAAIDKKGIAFKEADPSSGEIKIQGQGQPFVLKETVVKKEVLDAILTFAKEAKRRALFLQDGLSFDIVSETQIHANIQEGWSVYFTHTEDLSWQITKLQTVLENKIPPEKRKKLDYIDVRFGDQAYFKYH